MTVHKVDQSLHKSRTQPYFLFISYGQDIGLYFLSLKFTKVQDHFQQLNGILSQALTQEELNNASLANHDNQELDAAQMTKAEFIQRAKQYKLEVSIDEFLKSEMFKESFIFDDKKEVIRRISEEERFGADGLGARI